MRAKIIVKRLVKEEDLPVINGWLRARGLREVEEDGVPNAGFICFEGGEPVCAAFLRRCEGGVGIIEGMTSNPDMPGDVRHTALDVLVITLCKQASELEMTKVLAWTVDNSTLTRSARHGFQKLPQTLLAKDLRSVPLAN